MAILTEEMKQFVKEHPLAYVATASKQGVPNVSPKGSIQVVDDNTLVFAAIWSETTIKNLKENPQIAVALADAKTVKGFQFKGKATLETSGALYEQMSQALARIKLPKPKSIARITVTEVYQLPPARA